MKTKIPVAMRNKKPIFKKYKYNTIYEDLLNKIIGYSVKRDITIEKGLIKFFKIIGKKDFQSRYLKNKSFLNKDDKKIANIISWIDIKGMGTGFFEAIKNILIWSLNCSYYMKYCSTYEILKKAETKNFDNDVGKLCWLYKQIDWKLLKTQVVKEEIQYFPKIKDIE